MTRSIVVFLIVALVATTAAAQESRLDAIQKNGTLRVCTPGDYQPFSLAKPDGSYEGIDVDLVQSMAKALGVKVEFVKSPWPQLMDTFVEKCDVGVGSSVESLRLAHGDLCAARGEGLFVVMASNLPGVSFAIDWNPPATLDPSPFPGGDPGNALDAQRITRVWVHGVIGGCRVRVS